MKNTGENLSTSDNKSVSKYAKFKSIMSNPFTYFAIVPLVTLSLVLYEFSPKKQLEKRVGELSELQEYFGENPKFDFKYENKDYTIYMYKNPVQYWVNARPTQHRHYAVIMTDRCGKRITLYQPKDNQLTPIFGDIFGNNIYDDAVINIEKFSPGDDKSSTEQSLFKDLPEDIASSIEKDYSRIFDSDVRFNIKTIIDSLENQKENRELKISDELQKKKSEKDERWRSYYKD